MHRLRVVVQASLFILREELQPPRPFSLLYGKLIKVELLEDPVEMIARIKKTPSERIGLSLSTR